MSGSGDHRSLTGGEEVAQGAWGKWSQTLKLTLVYGGCVFHHVLNFGKHIQTVRFMSAVLPENAII